jgi:hypothetical protein
VCRGVSLGKETKDDDLTGVGDAPCTLAEHIITLQDRDLSEVASQWTYVGNRGKTRNRLSS